jgi:hypothetical protein
LKLSNARLGDEYYYSSLPLCVVDAIFSIGGANQGDDLAPVLRRVRQS